MILSPAGGFATAWETWGLEGWGEEGGEMDYLLETHEIRNSVPISVSNKASSFQGGESEIWTFAKRGNLRQLLTECSVRGGPLAKCVILFVNE